MNQIQQSVSTIIRGLAIYIITSIAASIVAIIVALTAGVALVAAAAGGASDGAVAALALGGIGTVGIISLIVSLGVIYGLYIYYKGLQLFAPALDAVGSAAAKNLSIGALLMLIATIFSAIGIFIPIFAWLISALCMIAAFILNILGYSALQKSETLNELGTAGARQLFMGFVFAIIATVCMIIPVVGWIAAFVLNILYWVYLFKGWAKIRASFAQ